MSAGDIEGIFEARGILGDNPARMMAVT